MDARPAVLAELVETRVAFACGVLSLAFCAVLLALSFSEERGIVVVVEVPRFSSSPVTLRGEWPVVSVSRIRTENTGVSVVFSRRVCTEHTVVGCTVVCDGAEAQRGKGVNEHLLKIVCYAGVPRACAHHIHPNPKSSGAPRVVSPN